MTKILSYEIKTAWFLVLNTFKNKVFLKLRRNHLKLSSILNKAIKNITDLLTTIDLGRNISFPNMMFMIL